MSSPSYSLSRLAAIYATAYDYEEPTLAFEVAIGQGRFVFMMFFSDEDKDSRDQLFVFLRNTNYLIDFKLYGSHRNGGTFLFMTAEKERRIRDELRLGPSGTPFDWMRFFEQVNAAIPQSLPLQRTLDQLRQVWPNAGGRLAKVLDDAHKTVLAGIKRLPAGQHPRYRTLRKLYMHTNASAGAIQRLIHALFAANITLVWTTDAKSGRTFAAIVSAVAQAAAVARRPVSTRR